MAKEIDVLIKELEAERAKLKGMIRIAVRDGEYLIAHYHNEALERIDQKLNTIKHFDDKLHWKKKTVEAGIQRAEQRSKRDDPTGFETYLEDMISKRREELKELHARGKLPVQQSDLLNERLQRLLEKKTRYVRIILMKSEGFALEIRRGKEGLKVSIPNIRSLQAASVVDDDILPKLKTLGFNMTSNQNKLVLSLAEERTDMLKRLKILISIIVFEIFHFSQFEGDSFIEWVE